MNLLYTLAQKHAMASKLTGGLAAMILLIVLFAGWQSEQSHSFEQVADLKQYLKGNDPSVMSSQTSGAYRFTLRYLPPEFFALEELEALEANDSAMPDRKNEATEKLKRYTDALYFRLTIAPENGRDLVFDPPVSAQKLGYQGWLQKLMFGLHEHVELSTAQHSEVELVTYHMDRNFGVAPSRSFLLVFPKRVEEEQLTSHAQRFLELRIEEFGLETGPLEFRFELPFSDWEVASLPSGLRSSRS